MPGSVREVYRIRSTTWPQQSPSPHLRCVEIPVPTHPLSRPSADTCTLIVTDRRSRKPRQDLATGALCPPPIKGTEPGNTAGSRPRGAAFKSKTVAAHRPCWKHRASTRPDDSGIPFLMKCSGRSPHPVCSTCGPSERIAAYHRILRSRCDRACCRRDCGTWQPRIGLRWFLMTIPSPLRQLT
jgi:hypothetical protein